MKENRIDQNKALSQLTSLMSVGYSLQGTPCMHLEENEDMENVIVKNEIRGRKYDRLLLMLVHPGRGITLLIVTICCHFSSER